MSGSSSSSTTSFRVSRLARTWRRVLHLSALDRKLLRDLLGMRGQAVAIALVIAAGVAMFVMYLSNFDSLQRTTRAYYERQRFGDVFVSLKRAPLALVSRIAAIPNVTHAEPRVVVDVTLDIPGFDEPASGRLISVPADRRPRLNDLFLREGRWIDPSRPDEVLASEAFCRAHGFRPGDRVGAIINGRLLDGARAARERLRHGGRLQRSRARVGTRGLDG
jgi:putative ABC transport system permease protein